MIPPTDTPDLDEHAVDPAPHLVTDEELAALIAHDHEEREIDRAVKSRLLVAAAIGGVLLAVAALVFTIVVLVTDGSDDNAAAPVTTQAAAKAAPAAAAASDAAPTLADAKGVAFEKFAKVDPTLPAVPAGAVKKFTVDVDQHVVQVSKDLAPTEAWSYTVNGKVYKGTAASPPIVVEQGDKVQITFVNGGSKAMHVNMAHSIDFHSAEVAPSKYYIDIAPGKKEVISFVAKHPGVFMYHCATQPVLMHTGAGMTGMMVVKPRDLPKVDKELWLTQGEYYIGQPGGLADMDKMKAKKPDVIAFNGYANQYKDHPITVRKGERVRMYVLNTGPSIWSAFHVIGTIFDRTVVEGTVGRSSQTVNLAPSQGGWVEFTLDQEGSFPFVSHAFGDMVKGALGVLRTTNAPAGGEGAAPPATSKPAAAKADVNVTLGDMWIKSDKPAFKAGKITFAVKNTGATAHGMGIVKAPAKVHGGMLDHSTMLAGGKDLATGKSESLAATLKPGKYELICHVPGHYMAGQHIPFSVTT